MHLSNKFNLDSINAIISTPLSTIAPTNVVQSDAGILLQRHLTHVNPKVLEKKYPKLVYDKLGIEIDNSGGYAQRIQSLRTTVEGSYGDKGSASGKVTINVEDSTIPVKLRETLIKWDVDEVEEGKIGNYNIVDRSFAGVIKVYSQEIDTAVVVGIESIGIKGLSNNTHYITSVGSNFAALTAKQQYDLIADNLTAQHNAVNASTESSKDKDSTDAYAANICLMPLTVFNVAQRTIINEFNNGTVLKVLRQNFPNVTFLQSPKLISDMVLFSNDESAIALRIPVPMGFSPILNQHFDFSTKSKYRLGGIDILEPASGRIVSGLA